MNRLTLKGKIGLCLAALLVAAGIAWAAGPQPTGSQVTYSQPISGANAAGNNIPIAVTDAGVVQVVGSMSVDFSSWTTPKPVYQALPDGGQPSIVTLGPWTATQGCIEYACNPQADGGVPGTNPTAGAHYDMLVDPNAGSAVRVSNGVPPTSYAAGPGRYLPSGVVLDYVPLSQPDGGSPSIYCVTPSGSTTLQLCPTYVNSR